MFYATWCVHCQQFSPEYRRAALELESEAEGAAAGAAKRRRSGAEALCLPVIAAVYCAAFTPLCQGEQIPAYPTMRALVASPGGGFSVEQFGGQLGSAEAVTAWARELASPEQVGSGGGRGGGGGVSG